jgi:hypothetical protein
MSHSYQYFTDFDIQPLNQAEIEALERKGAWYQLNEHSKGEWDLYTPVLWNESIHFLNVGWSIPNNYGARYVLTHTFALPFITAVGVVDELRSFFAKLEVRVIFEEWKGRAGYQILPTNDAELIQFILMHQQA